MSTLYLPHNATKALEAYIETLTPLAAVGSTEGYQQATSDAWKRALVPLHIERTPAPGTSLTFSLDDSERNQDGATRSLSTITYRCNARLRFLYLSRPDDQDADWRRSDLACHHLLSHLLSPTAAWPAGIDIIDDPGSTGYRRDQTTVSDVLLCEVRFAFSFTSPLHWS